ERDEQEEVEEPRRRKAHGGHSAPTCTIACTSIERTSAAEAVTTTFFPTTLCAARTYTAFEIFGGLFVRNAIECQALTNFSAGLHETRPNLVVPGPITTIADRKSSARPGGDTPAETGERPPPPPAGTQPRSGWKSWVFVEVETARKSA